MANQNLKLEIAGPFDSKVTGVAVETALISALKPDANSVLAPGPKKYRFRPIGVRDEFAKRVTAPPLSLKDLQKVLTKHKSSQFLCVKITDETFEYVNVERPGYDPTNPPDDKTIVKRIVRYWPLRFKRELWIEDRAQSPAVLLAIYGSPGAQFVIAAAEINRNGWQEMVSGDEVPLIEPWNLDMSQLRGRRIAREAGLKFNLKGFRLFPRLPQSSTIRGANLSSGAMIAASSNRRPLPRANS